jgi:hypothetical protein
VAEPRPKEAVNSSPGTTCAKSQITEPIPVTKYNPTGCTMPERPENSMAMLGKYLSLAMLVPSGALAGYWLGRFAAHWVHAEWPQPVGLVVGVIAATYKLLEQLLRETKRGERGGQNGGRGGGDA